MAKYFTTFRSTSFLRVIFGMVTIVMISLVLESSEAAEEPNIKFALPTKAELPTFADYQTGSRITTQTLTAQTFTAERRRDSMKLQISVGVYNSKEEAEEQSFPLTHGVNGRLKEGSPSGRKIGQQVWQSNYGADSPRSGFILVAHDGRSNILVKLRHRVPLDKEGEPIRDKSGEIVWRRFTKTDLNFAEKQAIIVLNKLTKMGYTSRSAK